MSEWNVSAPQSTDDDTVARLAAGDATIDLYNDRGAIRASAVAIRGGAAWAVRCTIDGARDVWHVPVRTVSSSEGGLERVAQGASVSFVRDLDLAPGDAAMIELVWSVIDE